MVLDTAGPIPTQNDVLDSTNGTGVVYSAYDVNADFNAILPLEGGDDWVDKSRFNPTNAVRLSDGEIVG